MMAEQDPRSQVILRSEVSSQSERLPEELSLVYLPARPVTLDFLRVSYLSFHAKPLVPSWSCWRLSPLSLDQRQGSQLTDSSLLQHNASVYSRVPDWSKSRKETNMCWKVNLSGNITAAKQEKNTHKEETTSSPPSPYLSCHDASLSGWFAPPATSRFLTVTQRGATVQVCVKGKAFSSLCVALTWSLCSQRRKPDVVRELKDRAVAVQLLLPALIDPVFLSASGHHVSCPTAPVSHRHLAQGGCGLDQSYHPWRESGYGPSRPHRFVDLWS
ncbi:hypothetical protein Q5P01_015473 [Channa striata]|uniref:Uncharacterized protein n=1 Tax=Channa striata TaxID=64152 RepID=A0AA88MBI8_CHASR|nr:hypothetical protein Q5P01_015473 [Channa striata]